MKIFYNGHIYAPGFPAATALVIDQGRILAIGSDSEICTSYSCGQSVNLNGYTVWPGLTDSHLHLQHLAESQAMVDCETPTLAECLGNVRETCEAQPGSSWVLGHGWNQNRWTEGFGTAAQLDAISGEHPVYLTAKSLHAAWANTKALQWAGVTAQSPDLPGGKILRDAQGKPTGILLEMGAMALVEEAIPHPTPESILSSLQNLIPELWQVGLVGAHDFDGQDCFIATQALAKDPQFPFHFRKNLPFDHLDDYIQAGLRTNQGGCDFQIGHVKLFADGALGPQTGAMLLPYEDSNATGTLLLSEEDILEIGMKAVSHGLALAVHAIGDRANRTVLNAFERLRQYETARRLPHLRHRIEHVQIIAPEDLPRLAQWDIVASVQPVHAPSDMHMADQYLGARARTAYAYRSLLQEDTTLIFGSDAPVEPVNPFLGIHAAVTRQRTDGSPDPDGWYPEQKLALVEALKGFSETPAMVSGQGEQLGRLAPGYQADLILLSKDPFELPPEELAYIRPLATLIGGRCVYRAPSFNLQI